MLSVVIQAGGESSRMGQDKALAVFLGQPLIVRLIDRLTPVMDELVVTTNQPQRYQFLGVRLAQDLIPGRGALGGLYTALSAASYPWVAVVACDMPFANPALLEAQRKLLVEKAVAAVIPRSPGGLEPFHALYQREACLPFIEQALAADKWRVDAWFSQVKIYFMGMDEVLQHDPGGLSFLNVNTPEELQAAEQLARQGENR